MLWARFRARVAERWRARALQQSALFDEAFYRGEYPDVASAGVDALLHCVRHGVTEDRQPNALFDIAWYRARYREELVASGLDPITHYIREGAQKGFDPHPLFDGALYARENPESVEGGSTALSHYLVQGEGRGRRPNAVFDPLWYREQNPDLAAWQQPLLAHYARFGEREGRRPHPLFHVGWYRQQHAEKLAAAGLEPLAHFLRGGSEEGCDPNPLFQIEWFRVRYRDELGAAQLDPLTYYWREGRTARCNPHPLFDAAWYRGWYADTLGADAEALCHYLDTGAACGYTPNPVFNPAWYLARYGVSLAPGETPFAHFARKGAPRGCRPGPLFDFCIQFFRDCDPQREAESPLGGWFYADTQRLATPGLELPIALPQAPAPRASIVIPHFGPPALVLACLRAISRAETQTPYEVIVVVDDPERGGAEVVAAIPNLRVIRNSQNEGFVAACNRGAETARGVELVFLNDDTLPADGWLDELVATRERFPEAGIVGAKLLFPNGLLQEAGGIVRSDGRAENFGFDSNPEAPQYAFARPVDYASAAALLVERRLFEELGGFDDAFRPAFYEDTDLAFRARERGRTTVYQPGAVVVHFGGTSYGRDPSAGLKRYQTLHRDTFCDRHALQLGGQPAPDVASEEAALARFRRHALVLDATMLTPDRDSGSLRMFHFLRLLQRFGYHVSFSPVDRSCPEAYVTLLRRWGIDVLVPPHLQSLEAWFEAWGWRQDLCVLSRPTAAEHWLNRAQLLCPRALLLYDTVDLHFLRRARELALRGVSGLPGSTKDQELRAARRADAVLAVSEVDRQLLLKEDPSLRVHVLSNIHELAPTRASFSEREGILFIGSFRHAPNRDAVQWFVHEVLPLVHLEIPQLRLHVIGSDMPEEVQMLGGDRVTIEGYVPDVTPWFERCRVSVAPLRYGAGVKGKVNQSMSHGVPCIATTVAAEGMELVAGQDVLIADDAKHFAAAVLDLYRDEELWKRLAENGLRNIERVFSVEAAERALAEILRVHGRS